MKIIFCILVLLGFASAQFSEKAQEDILRIHNNLRSAIAKGEYRINGTLLNAASNMRKMKWSSALATAAQNVANNCREESSRTAGENIFQDYFSTPETVIANIGAKASGAWVRDLEKLGWNSNKIDKATLGSKIAAATQMAWAETEFVGCGFNNCGKDSSKGNKSKILVVCHYKEIGNILNSNIYKEGDACSSCPTGYKCEGDSGLCVVGI